MPTVPSSLSPSEILMIQAVNWVVHRNAIMKQHLMALFNGRGNLFQTEGLLLLLSYDFFIKQANSVKAVVLARKLIPDIM